MALRASSAILLPLAICFGCREEAPRPTAAAESTGAAEIVSGRISAEAAKQLNPKGLPVYAGPVGSVRGVVTLTGDAPPLMPDMVSRLPADGCPRAHELQRKLFRQGLGGTLADVLVTVTEYQGYLEPKTDAVPVSIKGCAFDERVLAMTFGQHFDVLNLDAQAYMPRLVGAPTYALRVAMPGGSAVPILAPKPGHYALVDDTRPYVLAEVFVLNYPSFDVTGLDGKFAIDNLPVGDAKLTVYCPAIDKLVERRVRIEPNQPVDLELALTFSEAEYRAREASKQKK